MRQIFRGRGESLLAALVITLVLMGLAALIPAVARQLSARPAAAPSPTPTATAPPAAVLLPDELDKALQGVMTIANDQTFGTAFLIDAGGDFITASSLVGGSAGLRLIDNTGGMHQVRLIGIDSQLGVAMVRAATDGSAMTLGDSSTVAANDPVVVLASPKVENLNPSTPATVSAQAKTQWTLHLDDLPGNVGGPVVGPGARVVALLVRPSIAVPINLLQSDLTRWEPLSGNLLPLAPYPPTLGLRGSDTTSTPTSGATVVSVSPSQASRTQETVITIQGSGFASGLSLAVHFVPLAGSSGGFDGSGPSVTGSSTVTVKVPAGEVIQDYVIELINGDGGQVTSRVAFTVTP